MVVAPRVHAKVHLQWYLGVVDTPLPRRRLDARSLVALAHPLRLRLRDQLRGEGPATATQLARVFGESSGATSYHLRMLARHGFIEPDPGHAGGRERWWRATPELLQVVISDFLDDQAAREALQIVWGERERMIEERRRTWLAGRERWSPRWRDAAEDSVYAARLSPEQARDLTEELTPIIDRYVGCPPGDGARSVEIELAIFPTGEPE